MPPVRPTIHGRLTVFVSFTMRAATAEAAGATLLVEGKVGADGAVIYVDTGGGPGTIVEVLQPATGTEGVFAMIRDAAKSWDGSEPLRRLG